jgi:lysozyme
MDVSEYNAGVSLYAAKREGIQFLAARVSSGALTPDSHQKGRAARRDPQWPRFRDEGRSLWPGAFYCYHRIGAGQSAVEQADMFAAHNPDRSIPVMLDHEAGAKNIGTFHACLHEFRARGYNVVLSYIPDWWWESMGRPSLAGLPPNTRSEYPSRSAVAPSEAYRAVRPEHWVSYGGLPVVVLQFSCFARIGGYAPLCVDAYPGSLEEFSALLGSDDLSARDREALFVILEQMTGSRDPHQLLGYPPFPDTTSVSYPLTVTDYRRQAVKRLDETTSSVLATMGSTDELLSEINTTSQRIAALVGASLPKKE